MDDEKLQKLAKDIVETLKANQDLPDDLKYLSVQTKLFDLVCSTRREYLQEIQDITDNAPVVVDYSPYLPLEGSVGRN